MSYILTVCLFVFTGRAYGNLGLSHESLGNFEKAITYQEQHLSIAAQVNDKAAKTLAYSSLGELICHRSLSIVCFMCQV